MNIYPEKTDLIKHIAIDENMPTLLVGEAGLGKSYTAVLAAQSAERDCRTVNLSKQSDLVDLLGQFILEKDGENSVFKWVDGVITQAAQEGKVLILEELTMADGTILAALHGLFEKKPKLYTTNGDVKIHPDFRVIGTSNPSWTNYNGVSELNYAFEDRFVHILFDFPQRQTIEKFLEPFERNIEKRDIDIDDIYDVAKRLFELYPRNVPNFLSLRGLEFFSKLLGTYNVKQSFELAILNKMEKEERSKVVDIIDNYIAIY